VVKIEINKSDFKKVLTAIKKVKTEVTIAAVQSMTSHVSKEFADFLRSNIVNQEYGDFGHPMGDWKDAYPEYHPNDYWLFLGTLLKSIKHWKVPSDDKRATIYRVGLRYKGGGA